MEKNIFELFKKRGKTYSMKKYCIVTDNCDVGEGEWMRKNTNVWSSVVYSLYSSTEAMEMVNEHDVWSKFASTFFFLLGTSSWVFELFYLSLCYGFSLSSCKSTKLKNLASFIEVLITPTSQLLPCIGNMSDQLSWSL